jgi:Tfp pilus assembly protein PilF
VLIIGSQPTVLRYANSMRLHRFCRFAAFMVAGCVAVPCASAAGQTAQAGAFQEQLNRIGADLFSAAPHPAEAIEELKAILAAEPGLAEGHLLLGLAYRAQGAPELMGEAVAELRQAIALKPSLLMARLALARVYLDMARASRAREELQVALGEAPGRPEFLSLLGETERQLGSPRRSVDLNRQALQADEAFVQARYYLGLALLDLRQHADAIRELELVAQSGANPADAYLGLGTAYLEAGRVDDALAALGEAARADPRRPETHIRLARAYRLKGRLNDAVEQLKLATASATGALGALYDNVESDLHMEEGLVRMQQGRLEAAAESFERVLALNASHEPAKRQLAEVRKRLQDRARQKKREEPS